VDKKLELAYQAYHLKDEARAGWVLRRVHGPESVADHSWGTAFLCMLYAEQARVDPARSVMIALVHDIGEARTGDIATRVDPDIRSVSPEEKARLERDAVTGLTAGLPQSTVLELWEEYEESRSAEARFVRDMNLIDMCLQALLYEGSSRYDGEKQGADNFPHFGRLDEFFETARPRITSETGRTLFEQVERRYREVRKDPD